MSEVHFLTEGESDEKQRGEWRICRELFPRNHDINREHKVFVKTKCIVLACFVFPLLVVLFPLFVLYFNALVLSVLSFPSFHSAIRCFRRHCCRRYLSCLACEFASHSREYSIA